MLGTAVPVVEVHPREVKSTPCVSSYKCEDCGKIIASPSENPPPRCCGAEMRKIR
jgi:hypothetical protein